MPKEKQKSEDGIRIITKYPNRRLYDRTDSQYIPFASLKKLIQNGIAFKVIDDKTEEDVTRVVLTQIISEESIKNNEFMSEALLRQIIQFYGNSMGSAMGLFLEKAMANFLTIQNQITTPTEITKINEIIEETVKSNQEFLKNLYKM